MPKLVDHEQRRRQITDAARRVVARDGLRAATFQSVAAEAGVSVRLVQYYFGSKRDVLRATRHAVAADASARITQRLAVLGADATPRDVVTAILAEVLPTDHQRREDSVVLDSFFLDTLTGSGDGDASTGDADGASRFLIGVVHENLARLRSGSPEIGTADVDAQLIVAAASGLAQAMLVNPDLAARADQLLDRLLDRMMGD